MRYSRKNISELLETVNGGPDVQGFSTSNQGWNFILVASGPGTVWQSTINPSHRICSEDGATAPTEDCR